MTVQTRVIEAPLSFNDGSYELFFGHPTDNRMGIDDDHHVVAIGPDDCYDEYEAFGSDDFEPALPSYSSVGMEKTYVRGESEREIRQVMVLLGANPRDRRKLKGLQTKRLGPNGRW